MLILGRLKAEWARLTKLLRAGSGLMIGDPWTQCTAERTDTGRMVGEILSSSSLTKYKSITGLLTYVWWYWNVWICLRTARFVYEILSG